MDIVEFFIILPALIVPLYLIVWILYWALYRLPVIEAQVGQHPYGYLKYYLGMAFVAWFTYGLLHITENYI